MFEKLANLDRRIIFLLIALAVLIPLLFPINIPISQKSSGPVFSAYDYIENTVPEGGTVLMSFDYDPATYVEIEPMAVAIIKHCFKRNIRVVTMALWPQGSLMAERVFSIIQEDSEYELIPADANGVPIETEVPEGKTPKFYGKDYVNVGYSAGQIVVVQAISRNFQGTFPLDTQRREISKFEITKNIRGFDGFDLIVALSAGDPGIPIWVQVAATQHNQPVIGGCTAVSAPMFFAYYQTQQLKGLIGGMKGAADYEVLTEQSGTASKGMDAQSIAHLMIIVFIIFSNIFYFATRKKEGK